MTISPDDPRVHAAALALYKRESERANRTTAILSDIAHRPVSDAMEPWEECAATFIGDAMAALLAADAQATLDSLTTAPETGTDFANRAANRSNESDAPGAET